MASATATLAPSPATSGLANVLYEKRDAIAYVTVNRPKVLNALNTPTWKDLRTAFETARDDATVRGVILTGAGNKAFIAGADIGELAHLTAYERSEEHTSELQSPDHLVCRLLLEKKKITHTHSYQASYDTPSRSTP